MCIYFFICYPNIIFLLSTRKLLNAPIKKIALENPVSVISTKIRKPNQIIQPWMFGDLATKTTCLWTKGLPNLIPDVTKKPELEYHYTKSGKRMQKWMYDIRCKTTKNGVRRQLASKTFKGIAKAMANQWSKEIENEATTTTDN